MAESPTCNVNEEISTKITTETEEENNEEGKKIDESDDKELYDLLDSALEDFKNPGLPQDTTAAVASASAAAPSEKDVATTSSSADGEWSDEFLEQATAQFQDAMKAFLGDDSSLSEEFRKMAKATGKAMASKEPDTDLTESIAQTLKGLSENAEAVSNPLSEEEISQLLSNIGLSSDGTNDENESEGLLNIIKNVMQNLLSKELLYPAFKEIVDKYPNWLKENRPSLVEGEYEKYSKQYELMKLACEEFETEKADDTTEVKKARFERVLDLMQKMQPFGNPPKDLLGDMGPGFELDEHGNPKIPGLPSLSSNGTDSCSIM